MPEDLSAKQEKSLREILEFFEDKDEEHLIGGIEADLGIVIVGGIVNIGDALVNGIEVWSRSQPHQ